MRFIRTLLRFRLLISKTFMNEVRELNETPIQMNIAHHNAQLIYCRINLSCAFMHLLKKGARIQPVNRTPIYHRAETN